MRAPTDTSRGSALLAMAFGISLFGCGQDNPVARPETSPIVPSYGETLPLVTFSGEILVVDSDHGLRLGPADTRNPAKFRVVRPELETAHTAVEYGSFIILTSTYDEYVGVDEDGQIRTDHTDLGPEVMWQILDPDSLVRRGSIGEDDSYLLRSPLGQLMTWDDAGRIYATTADPEAAATKHPQWQWMRSVFRTSSF